MTLAKTRIFGTGFSFTSEAFAPKCMYTFNINKSIVNSSVAGRSAGQNNLPFGGRGGFGDWDVNWSLIFGGQCHSFWFSISQPTSKITYWKYPRLNTNVVWAWGGLEACLFWNSIDVIVLRVKVSKGIEPFSPIGMDTSQPPHWEICMDKSRLLPNNPARQ